MGLLEGLSGENRGGDLDAEKFVVTQAEMSIQELTELTRVHDPGPKTTSTGKENGLGL